MSDEKPFVDPACQRLANYLYQHLNAAYPEQTIVQSVRYYDAFNVPANDYPLLKVYRLQDRGSIQQNDAQCSAVISYGLILPDMDKLAPIMAWMRKRMRLYLAAFTIECPGFPRLADEYSAEYRTMLNELTNKVYMFLRFNLTFTDTDT